MANEIIPYLEMCAREALSLQRGMNFDLGRGYSVILMSLRPNAPYRDRLDDDGSTLTYEGHDSPRSEATPNPKEVDQPERTPSGSLTQNGKFFAAAAAYKRGEANPQLVKVYEKIHQGIWSYNGTFRLVDSWRERDWKRMVFKFKLVVAEDAETSANWPTEGSERRRLIPTPIKVEVWKRDRGRCVMCGAADELHFDHVLPYSRGGTSVTAENVQLLCARHNLSKGAKIV
ncbi:MAG: HNH endonuclease [Acidobacteria bacterium]|nr:HNH endonuclease [Acidobacteriota bacterium]